MTCECPTDDLDKDLEEVVERALFGGCAMCMARGLMLAAADLLVQALPPGAAVEQFQGFVEETLVVMATSPAEGDEVAH